MTRLLSAVAAGLVTTSIASAAAAQTREPAVFLTGIYFSGMERSAHTTTTPVDNLQIDLSGRTYGQGFGIGTFVRPHWSVQFELTMPQTLARSAQSPDTISGVPLSYVEQLSVSQTVRAGTVLFAYHTAPERRVRLAYLGGLSLISDEQRALLDYVSSPLGFPLPASQTTTSVVYHSAATAGLDVDVRIVPHLAVSPQVRVYGYGGTLMVRSGLALRLAF